MSPRPYKMTRRQQSVEETRRRIVTAGLDLLSEPHGPSSITVEAVALRTGVSRMTVYHQFGSKQGLLVALFDGIRERGQGELIGAALEVADPLDALDGYIEAVARFRQGERVAIRRVRAMATLDPDFDAIVRKNEQIGRDLQRSLVERIAGEYGQPRQTLDEAAAALHAVTSFETFEDLAGEGRTHEEVAPLIQYMAHAVLGVASAEPEALGRPSERPTARSGERLTKPHERENHADR